MVDEQTVKPSKEISPGAIVTVKRKGVVFSYKVLAIPKNRLGAKLVSDYMSDQTSEEEKTKMKLLNERNLERRERGQGRPTKKERRNLDQHHF